MKVYIGPYKSYIGPYQIARVILFFMKKDSDLVHKLGGFLAGVGKEEFSLLSRFCFWVESKRKRTIKVKLHPSDTWNADETLAHVILPVLRQLKKDKHSSAKVDNVDVPEHLHRPEGVDDYTVDDNWYARWDYVLDEMIHSFECRVDPSWEDAFFKDDKFDRAGYDVAQARVSNGFRLFGKYYESLWS